MKSTASAAPELGDKATEDRLRRAIATRVKLNHLRIFLEVARRESVSRAANALNLAQPAVTKTLREFEELLATELFERRARGVVLNEAGRLVLPHVHAVFADLGRIGDHISSFKGGWAGTIAVGATMSALPYLLPKCLADPRIQQSDGLVRVVEGTIDQMLRALLRGELDLVIGRVLSPEGSELLECRIIFDDPFVPVVGAGHPLAGKAGHRLAELSDYGWVIPPFGSSAAEPLERYMLHNRIRPARKVIETVSYQTILRLLEDMECIAILPQHIARNGERRGTLSIVGPALSEGSLPIGTTYRSDRPLTPLGQALMASFEQAVSAITI